MRPIYDQNTAHSLADLENARWLCRALVNAWLRSLCGCREVFWQDDGPVGLWYPGDWPEPEIKWSLSREFWGKGYATEAALAVQTMAFQTLKRDRLISLILPENEASKRVAKRLGGIYEKTIPFRDGLAEIYVYSCRRSAVGPGTVI